MCELLLKNNAAVNLKSIYGDNALHLAVVKGKYDVCKLLLKHGAHVDNLNKKGASILDSAYATRNQKIISLIKKHENNKNVQQEIEKTRKHLKMLQIKRVIDTKKEMLTKIEEMITSLHQLKEFHLEKQRKKNNLENQVDIFRSFQPWSWFQEGNLAHFAVLQMLKLKHILGLRSHFLYQFYWENAGTVSQAFFIMWVLVN